jgi:hypothetical protein
VHRRDPALTFGESIRVQVDDKSGRGETPRPGSVRAERAPARSHHLGEVRSADQATPRRRRIGIRLGHRRGDRTGGCWTGGPRRAPRNGGPTSAMTRPRGRRRRRCVSPGHPTGHRAPRRSDAARQRRLSPSGKPARRRSTAPTMRSSSPPRQEPGGDRMAVRPPAGASCRSRTSSGETRACRDRSGRRAPERVSSAEGRRRSRRSQRDGGDGRWRSGPGEERSNANRSRRRA